MERRCFRVEVNDPIYFTLFILLKHRGKLESDTLELKLMYSFNFSSKESRRWVAMMEDRGLIHIEREYSPEYSKCLETAKEDKRIKDPQKYCGRKYPSVNIIMITSRGLAYYIDKYIKLCIGLGNDEVFCYEDIHKWLCKIVNFKNCDHNIKQLVLCRHRVIRDRYPQECSQALGWAVSLYREYTNIVNT